MHNGKKEGIMVLNVLFGVKRRDGGLGEQSTEQVTVLHVPLMPFSAAKLRNELGTLKTPRTGVRSMKLKNASFKTAVQMANTIKKDIQ